MYFLQTQSKNIHFSLVLCVIQTILLLDWLNIENIKISMWTCIASYLGVFFYNISGIIIFLAKIEIWTCISINSHGIVASVIKLT